MPSTRWRHCDVVEKDEKFGYLVDWPYIVMTQPQEIPIVAERRVVEGLECVEVPG